MTVNFLIFKSSSKSYGSNTASSHEAHALASLGYETANLLALRPVMGEVNPF